MHFQFHIILFHLRYIHCTFSTIVFESGLSCPQPLIVRIPVKVFSMKVPFLKDIPNVHPETKFIDADPSTLP